jgi:hypothetical protein
LTQHVREQNARRYLAQKKLEQDRRDATWWIAGMLITVVVIGAMPYLAQIANQ